MQKKNNKLPSLITLLGLAQQLASQGKYEEAAASLEQLFACAKRTSKTSAQLLDLARHFYYECQSKLLTQQHLAARQVVVELLAQTEKLGGFPIDVAIEDDVDNSGVDLAWIHDRDHHVVVCPREPEQHQPYELASGLIRIQSDSEVYRAGKMRFPTVSERQKGELLSLYDPQEAQRLVDEGGLWITLNPHPDDIALEPLRMLVVSVPFMQVDARLRQRFPVLRPAQFLSRAKAFNEQWQARKDFAQIWPKLRLRERTITALDGLNGLFLDWLFSGATDFAARYHNLDGFDLSRRLWQQWESSFPEMQPGDECGMIDEFAEILGLSGYFEWVKVPFVTGNKP